MSTAVLERPEAPAPPILRPRNDVILLHGVTWEQYLALRENPENDGVRMYYAEGELLEMTTGGPHERIKMLLDKLLTDWALRNEVDVMSYGQWTMQRRSLQSGLEADNCYYISSLAAVKGKAKLDLEADPAPDLAIEVDITTHSAHKFSIYASLGVAELWVWKQGALVVFRRNAAGTYEESSSEELPVFPFDAAARAINENFAESDLKVIQAFRSADPTFGE